MNTGHLEPGMTEAGIYRFDGIVVDLGAHQVMRDGAELALEPKAFAVLAALLEQAGTALERDELLDRVWGHRHVTPGVLNRVIAQLRKALGDNAEHPRYIQTLHSLGYRFIADVERVESRPESEPSPPHIASPPHSTAAADSAGVADPASGSGSQYGRRAFDRRASRRLLVPVLVVVAALAVLALVWRQQMQAQVKAEASIAVLPFSSLSSNPDDRYFAEGLAVEMHDALAGVPGLTVAAPLPPGSDVRNEDAKALGKRLGVATVLDASVRRDDNRVRINARLSDTRTGFTLWAETYDRGMSDVFAMQSTIANQVVQELLGILPGEVLSQRLAPTRSVEAYDAYLKGISRLQQAGAGDHVMRAVGFFKEALAADRNFARAQAGICRSEIRQFESVREADAYARAKTACMQAARMDPGLREVDLALGELYRVKGESAKAIEAYSKASEDPALAADAYIGIAMTHGGNDRHDLAMDYFARAKKLRPADANLHRYEGVEQYRHDDFVGAIASFRRAVTLQPDNAKLWSSLGGIYMANGNVQQAANAFKRSLAIEPSYSALSNLGTLNYQIGDHAVAASLYRQAAELDEKDFRIWGNIGDALAAQGHDAEAARHYRRAAEMAKRYIAIKNDDAEALATLAWYRANLGDGNAAKKLVLHAEALGTQQGEVAFFAAQTFALLRDDDKAHDRIRQALAQRIPAERIAASPILVRLDANGEAESAIP
jgi:TolB-like protein/DNA-binding winged helix-turn-helix (wHTH) protein/Flp pilus assembly protein TadD